MGSFSLSSFTKGARLLLKRHSPEILTAIGIGGMLTTIILAVRATPKAIQLIEGEKYDRAKAEQEDGIERNFTALDAVKVSGKCYIPAIITGTLSVACLIGANSVNLRRNAALAAACTLSEATLRRYKEKVIETIGEKREEAVRDEIAKETIEKNPPQNREVVIVEKGNTLCYDNVSGRYFKSDIDKLKRAMNEFNRDITSYGYASLNDLYYKFGLDNIGIGDVLGWEIDDGIIDLDFSSQLTSDDTPCIVIDYSRMPHYY